MPRPEEVGRDLRPRHVGHDAVERARERPQAGARRAASEQSPLAHRRAQRGAERRFIASGPWSRGPAEPRRGYRARRWAAGQHARHPVPEAPPLAPGAHADRHHGAERRVVTSLGALCAGNGASRPRRWPAPRRSPCRRERFLIALRRRGRSGASRSGEAGRCRQLSGVGAAGEDRASERRAEPLAALGSRARARASLVSGAPAPRSRRAGSDARRADSSAQHSSRRRRRARQPGGAGASAGMRRRE